MTSTLTDDDLIALATCEVQDLAKGWCLLNSWGWPEWLPNPEPPERYKSGSDRRRSAMQWIENRIGFRRVLREWNHNMTDEEYEDFYRGHYEGNSDAAERDLQRTIRKCGLIHDRHSPGL